MISELNQRWMEIAMLAEVDSLAVGSSVLLAMRLRPIGSQVGIEKPSQWAVDPVFTLLSTGYG